MIHVEHFMITEKDKIRARARTNYYIRTGRIKKTRCEDCGNDKVEAHHNRYDSAFDLRFLCRRCHVEHHLDLRYPGVMRKQLGLF
jgi:ribosomal protein S27AE